MKPNWLTVIIAFLLGIGLTYLLVPKEPTPFTMSPKKPSDTSGVSFAPPPPLDTAQASEYVRNYKRRFAGGTYAFTILGNDIASILNHGNFAGIRIYLGLTSANDPRSGTAIITGVNSVGGDLYLETAGREFAIDQSTPCPTDCPYGRSQATAPATPAASSKDMLGRMSSDPN